jgi:EAL domain-containing protein (putative c-di-GMP-specific phosphodiesterase class I)
MERCVDPIQALQNGWIELWYQPKVDAQALAMLGAEALLRVRHPVVGVVPPRFFIETPGEFRVQTLSESIIKLATSDWTRFLADRRVIETAIDLPIAYFRDQRSIDYLCRHLPDHAGFPGLVLEFDSADFARNWELAKSIAQTLRYRKVVLSVDRVGARCTWLREIREVPFVELKIDPALVRGCATDKRKRFICQEIYNLAKGFGVRIVAEGVDSWSDALVMRDLGCQGVQGSLFAKPAPHKQFATSCWADRWLDFDRRVPLFNSLSNLTSSKQRSTLP